MILWRIVAFTAFCALGAGWFLAVAFWDNAKSGLLVALSVMAAGVLVRLARGIPFNNPDHYQVEEIRELVAAVKQIMRSLRALLFIILMEMISLVACKPIWDFLQTIKVPAVAHYSEAIISGWIGGLFAYAFIRIAQVVNGDRDLVDLQARFLVRAVERRQAEVFAPLETKSADIGFKTPDGYGKITHQ